MDLEVYLLLGVCSFIAGVVDSIAGGGGLLTVPALLSAGLPPAVALATNKLQSSFGSFSASYFYLSRKVVKLSEIRGLIFTTFLGAALGTYLVQNVGAGSLTQGLPYLMILFALYFAFSPRIGDVDRSQRLTWPVFSVASGLSIGFYDGFFGPGTGSFWALAFVSLAGFGLSKATAHSKVLNFVSNITSLAVFLAGGKVLWSVGLVMGCGQFLGAQVGSRWVVHKGTALIRPVLVIVSILMSLKLLLF